MIGMMLARTAMRGGRTPPVSAGRALAAGAVIGVGALVLGPVIEHADALPAMASQPRDVASWARERGCGYPAQMAQNVSDDLAMLESGYQVLALNLPDMASELNTDATAARGCQPAVMTRADRAQYERGLAEAIAAANVVKTAPAQLPRFMNPAIANLNAVAARTGEDDV